jgi:hypothetical protein
MEAEKKIIFYFFQSYPQPLAKNHSFMLEKEL